MNLERGCHKRKNVFIYRPVTYTFFSFVNCRFPPHQREKKILRQLLTKINKFGRYATIVLMNALDSNSEL